MGPNKSQGIFWLSFTVFVVGWLATLWIWQDTAQHSLDLAAKRFEYQTNQITAELIHQLDTKESSLRSIAALITAREGFNLSHWRRYFLALESTPSEKEARLMTGYAPRVPAAQRTQHEEQGTQAGLPAYRIEASAEREEYFPLAYLMSGQRPVRFRAGEDLRNDPEIARAMENAVVQGDSVLAGPIHLQMEPPPGAQVWAIIVPVYASTRTPPTPEARQSALLGYAIEAFLADDLVTSTLGIDGSVIGLHIDEGDQPVFRHTGMSQQLGKGWRPPFALDTEITWNQRLWRLRYAALEGYNTESTFLSSALVIAAGLIISVLLSVLVGVLGTSRSRALSMVESKTLALRDALDEYASSETRLRAVFDNALEAIVTINHEGRIENYNPAAQAIFGWTAGEVSGQKIQMLMADPVNRQDHDQYIERYLQGQAPKIIGVGRHVKGRHKDGHEIPLDLGVSEMRIGDQIFFCGIIRDISQEMAAQQALEHERAVLESRVKERTQVLTLTNQALHEEIEERRRVEIELKAARELALQSAQAKAEFLANMSHEIRTPMNAVIASSALLGETLLDGEQERYLRNIETSGQALLDVINDILDFSKIESGKLELESRPFHLRQLVEHSLDMVRSTLDEKGVKLDLDFDETLPAALLGDGTRLRQVVLNLLSNAAKFTERGRVGLRVRRARTSQPEPFMAVHFEVHDTGIGMSEEQLSRLFRAFTQADSSITRRYGGTGLGLAISARIVQWMGGKLSVESVLAQGSCFTFELPFEAVKDDSVPDLQPLRRKLDGQLARKLPLRILVVEDNDTNREIAQTILGKMGYMAHEAVNGQQAIERLHQQHYDLVFMDLQMPIMDGLTATLAIRQDFPAHRQPLIVAMTANALSGDRERCLAAGMNDFVTKPIFPVTLQDVIQRLAERTEPKSKAAEAPVIATADEPLLQDAVLDELSQLSSPEDPLLQRLLLDHQRQCPQWLSEVQDLAKRCAKAKDVEPLHTHEGPAAEWCMKIHRFAGACASLGLKRLSQQCRAIEAALRDGQLSLALEQQAALPDLCQQTEQALVQRHLLPARDASGPGA